MTSTSIAYRLVGDTSEGIEVTPAGMRKLIARGVLDHATHEYRTDGAGQWSLLAELAAQSALRTASVASTSGDHATIRCPHCDHLLRVDARHRLARRTAECNRCREKFVLPDMPPPLPTATRSSDRRANPERELVCPFCSTKHTWRWDLEDKTVRCRSCRATFVSEVPPGAEEDQTEAERLLHGMERMARFEKKLIAGHRDDAITYFVGGLGLVALAAIATWVSGEIIGTGMIVFYGLAIVGIGMACRGFGAFTETISPRVKRSVGFGALGALGLLIVRAQLSAHFVAGSPASREPPNTTTESAAADPALSPATEAQDQPTGDAGSPAPVVATPGGTGSEATPLPVAVTSPTEVVAASAQAPAAAEAVKVEICEPTAKPLDYLPMRAGTEWIYRRTVQKGCVLPFSPVFLNAPGLLSHSNTHGCWRVSAAEETFSVRVTEVSAPRDGIVVGKIETTGDILLTWLPPVKLAERRLRIHADSASFDVILEGYFHLDEPEPLGIGNWLAEGMHVLEEVTVPAGSFPKARRFTRRHDENTNTPAFTERSWFAPFVGLVRYELAGEDGVVLMAVELTAHRP